MTSVVSPYFLSSICFKGASLLALTRYFVVKKYFSAKWRLFIYMRRMHRPESIGEIGIWLSPGLVRFWLWTVKKCLYD
mgnify:CR=1 FL=1